MVKDARRQLTALFGETLVGPWPELDSNVESVGPTRRRRRWLWRIGAVALTVAVVLAGRALVMPGLERRDAEDRNLYIERLRMALLDGHVEDAARLVDVVQGSSQELDAADPRLAELLRAEAAAYRYFDARPQRLALVEPYLRDGAAGAKAPAARVARYAVQSREERAQHLAELDALLLELPNDAEVAYLVASAREQRGDIAGAREAYRRSEALGPAWLSHRFDQVCFERWQGNASAAADIASSMLRSDPSSPWARFAASLSALPVPPLAIDAGVPVTFPVQIYRVKLVQGIQAAAQGDVPKGERLVHEALGAVQGEPPFVIDAFDYLMQNHAQGLARTAVESQYWPKNSKTAAAKQRDLAKGASSR